MRKLLLASLWLALGCGSVRPLKTASKTAAGDATGTSGPSGTTGPASPSAPTPSSPTTPGVEAGDDAPFTLSFSSATDLRSSTLDLMTNSPINLTVYVRRGAGFSDPVSVSVLNQAGATITTSGSTGYDITLPSSLTTRPGTASYSVRGTSGALASTIVLQVVVSAPVAGGPTISSVEKRVGSAGPFAAVKQGFGAVTLRLLGSNLSGVTSVELRAPGVTTLPCVSLTTGTATQRECSITVPHGALGAYALHLSGSNTQSLSNALTITSIQVDNNNPASQDAVTDPSVPFHSLDYARGFSGSGDLIELASSGFPYLYPRPIDTNPCLDPINTIKPGVTLDGHGASLFGDGSSAALVLEGTATVRNLTVRDSAWGIVALENSVVSLSQVTVIGNSTTTDTGVLLCRQSRASASASSVEGWMRGYLAWDGSSLKLSGGTVHDNVTGLYAANATVTVKNTVFENNTLTSPTSGPLASQTSGIFVAGTTDMKLNKIRMTTNGANYGPLTEAGLVLADNTTTTIDGGTFNNGDGEGVTIKLMQAAGLGFTTNETNLVPSKATVGYQDARDSGAKVVEAPHLLFEEHDPSELVTGNAADSGGRWSIEIDGNQLDLR